MHERQYWPRGLPSPSGRRVAASSFCAAPGWAAKVNSASSSSSPPLPFIAISGRAGAGPLLLPFAAAAVACCRGGAAREPAAGTREPPTRKRRVCTAGSRRQLARPPVGPPGEDAEARDLRSFQGYCIDRRTRTKSPALAEGTLTWGIFLKF